MKLLFTGVVVPNILFKPGETAMNEPQGLLNMLGLHFLQRPMFQATKPGEKHGAVVAQYPSRGTVVPFGTAVRYVVAR